MWPQSSFLRSGLIDRVESCNINLFPELNSARVHMYTRYTSRDGKSRSFYGLRVFWVSHWSDPDHASPLSHMSQHESAMFCTVSQDLRIWVCCWLVHIAAGSAGGAATPPVGEWCTFEKLHVTVEISPHFWPHPLSKMTSCGYARAWRVWISGSAIRLRLWVPTSLQEVKEVPLIQWVRICESESAVDSCMMSLPGSLDLWICYGYGSESARVCRKFHWSESNDNFWRLPYLLKGYLKAPSWGLFSLTSTCYHWLR